MRDDPFSIVEDNKDKIIDKFDGWELIEFLQIPTEDVLEAIKDFGWVDEDNVEDFIEFIGLKR